MQSDIRPWAADRCRSTTCWWLGHTAGGEQRPRSAQGYHRPRSPLITFCAAMPVSPLPAASPAQQTMSSLSAGQRVRGAVIINVKGHCDIKGGFDVKGNEGHWYKGGVCAIRQGAVLWRGAKVWISHIPRPAHQHPPQFQKVWGPLIYEELQLHFRTSFSAL